MRRLIIIFSVVIVLALLAGVGYFGLGWWHPSHATISETAGGYDAASEPATLAEALAMRHQSLDEIEQKVHDYSAVIIKKERIGNDPVETVMFAKVREKPFSVYLYFLDRSDKKGLKGREVIYVQGRNDDKLLVHTPGIHGRDRGHDGPGSQRLPGHAGRALPDHRDRPGQPLPATDQRGESAGDPSQVEVKRYRHARINTQGLYLAGNHVPGP